MIWWKLSRNWAKDQLAWSWQRARQRLTEHRGRWELAPRSPGLPGSGARAWPRHLHRWFLTLTFLLSMALCFLVHGMRSWLSILLPLAPLGAQQRLGVVWGISIQPAGRASPGRVKDPKHKARSSTGTTPLAMLVWFLPKLADPIHGARHMSVTPRHEPCAWPSLSSL